MNYYIQLYTIETKERYLNFNGDEFFPNQENIARFTEQQYQDLKEKLLKYGYSFAEQTKYGLKFTHPKYPISALLKVGCVCFTAEDEDEFVSETHKTIAAIASHGFATYDPQEDEGEEWTDL